MWVRDRIELIRWHLDVDSVKISGSSIQFSKSVHFIIFHASWVQIDVNQVGLYLCAAEVLRLGKVRKDFIEVNASRVQSFSQLVIS